MILIVKNYLHTNKTEPVRLCFTEIEAHQWIKENEPEIGIVYRYINY